MLNVAFLWHMHQPWYMDPDSGRFALPWVRLHAVKDYLDMVEILSDFPRVRMTVNAAPCLLEQVEMYGQGRRDELQLLSEKPAAELTPPEAARLIETGFYGIPETMIHPYPRYYQLMAKAGRKQPFSANELRDLQVWANLAWVDPRWRREVPLARDLVKKGTNFTEEEKLDLLRFHLELLARVIPTYKEYQQNGRIELSSSPWAHPILPLLHDSETARVTNPGMPLPGEAFRFPEDVGWHLSNASSQFTRWFGKRPAGLWPSEGSVSPTVLPPISEAGYRWLATDEEILWKSWAIFSAGKPRPSLYQPFRVGAGDKAPLTMVFRDHTLSDLIGFVYSSWEPEAAASDFLARLHAIEKGAAGGPPPLVVVALDGENAWESYREDGEPFLRALYGALSGAGWVNCCTVSEHIGAHPPQAELPGVAPGSWIRGEFSTWIGHEPQNKAWEELVRARRLIAPKDSRAIAIAEGSDWFWWLGPEHSSPQDPVFDRIFRSYVKAAYQAAGQPVPARLDQPLKPAPQAVSSPVARLTPTVDGEVTSYFEWLHAGDIDLTHTGSAMARAKPLLSRVCWGSDGSVLYLRLDPSRPLSGPELRVLIEESRFQLKLSFRDGRVAGSCAAGEKPEFPVEVRYGRVVEAALPLSSVGLGPSDHVRVTISVEQDGMVVERYPEHGQFALAVAAPVEAGLWSA